MLILRQNQSLYNLILGPVNMQYSTTTLMLLFHSRSEEEAYRFDFKLSVHQSLLDEVIFNETVILPV